MEELINISTLNDFIFCPYSIYLHNVYMEVDESLFHATPQTIGRIAHSSVDSKIYTTSKDVLQSIPIVSNRFGLIGKIDLFYKNDKLLVERKYQLKQIYQGQLYQIWAQYLCLLEMGYEVEHLEFFEISTKRRIPLELPSTHDIEMLCRHIEKYKHYNPADVITINPNKCVHCVYCNLCDKTSVDNVY